MDKYKKTWKAIKINKTYILIGSNKKAPIYHFHKYSSSIKLTHNCKL
jgi:hypothetical protein